MSIFIQLIKEKEFKKIQIEGVNHYLYDFNDHKYDYSILATMHNKENTNNLEVLKFALWCRKNNIKLTMYGILNQLPLFSLFSDSVILQDQSDWSKNTYPEKPGDHDATTYFTKDMFATFKSFDICDNSNLEFNSCLNLFRHGQNPPSRWPIHLALAEKNISDEEVVDFFSFPKIYIRHEAYAKYKKIKNIIPQDLIMCEVRVCGGCGGEHLLSILKEKTKDYPIPICFDLDFRKKICNMSGQDYMSIQILCSLINNWMWIAYGGSSNMLPFFPIKILSVSDIYCRYELIKKLFLKRYGPDLGSIFPDTDTLIYCFPEEKDGPTRTDGHPPLPNLRDLTKDLSNYKMDFEIKGDFFI